MSTQKHFFFKQGGKNNGFNILLSVVGLDGLRTKSVDFGIFYDNSLNPQNMQDGSYMQLKLSKNSKPQITDFISIKEGDCIWFFETKVYCFQCMDSTISEHKAGDPKTPSHLDQGSGNTNSKTKKFKLVEAFELYNVSEMFSATSGHLGYNRKTIREFKPKTPQYDVCKHLIEGQKIQITGTNFLNYLSPSQFESLSFMIFYLNGRIPRSHIGGTRKHVDLEVFNQADSTARMYQVKKKDLAASTELDYLFKENIWTIHTGATKLHNKTLGVQWLLRQICNNKLQTTEIVDLQTWLRHLYPETLFDYQDVCSLFESQKYAEYLDEFKLTVTYTPSALLHGDPVRGKTKSISINHEGEVNCEKYNHIEDRILWKSILDELFNVLALHFDGEDLSLDKENVTIVFESKGKTIQIEGNRDELVSLAQKLEMAAQ